MWRDGELGPAESAIDSRLSRLATPGLIRSGESSVSLLLPYATNCF
jgi:hypothetical protein